MAPSRVPCENSMAADMQNVEPIMPKVPPLLLMDEKTKEDCTPTVVSIGPYHHGKPELGRVQAFKPTAVRLFIEGDQRGDHFYKDQVRGMINGIRNYYVQQCLPADLTNHRLATMMLRDACFIIIFMEATAPETLPPNHPTMEKIRAVNQGLGMLTMPNVWRDLFLLENQIPLSVIKLLMDSRHGNGAYENLLRRFLKAHFLGEYRQKAMPKQLDRVLEQHPYYILEAFHMLLTSDCTAPVAQGGAAQNSGAQDAATQQTQIQAADENDVERGSIGYLHSYRSVKYLKKKGVQCEPSRTRQSLMDVKFKSKVLSATLQLPEWCVSVFTRVYFSNMIAYEYSPNSRGKGEVTSYVNFIKSLIESPKDVRELREKKILFNRTLGSDEQVLNMYRDINTYRAIIYRANTYGENNLKKFQEVKEGIQKHCDSKTKTWMAELKYTHFRTPWTVIALLATAILLALTTAAQVHYTIHPN